MSWHSGGSKEVRGSPAQQACNAPYSGRQNGPATSGAVCFGSRTILLIDLISGRG